MGRTISFEDAGFLLLASNNSVRGYTTAKMGNKFRPVKGRVPYEAVPSLLEYRINTTKSKIERSKDSARKAELEEDMKTLRNNYIMVTQRSFGEVVETIASARKYSSNLSRKVLDTEEDKKPETAKIKKPNKSRGSHLTERELNMPLDDLVNLTLRKIYKLKKSIEKNPTPEKEEELRNLETKYRSIGRLFK